MIEKEAWFKSAGGIAEWSERLKTTYRRIHNSLKNFDLLKAPGNASEVQDFKDELAALGAAVRDAWMYSEQYHKVYPHIDYESLQNSLNHMFDRIHPGDPPADIVPPDMETM